jgi:amino acid transporter
MNKISTWQLVLISTGGMIGAGWLFSPYYGFETAGAGVTISWLLVAIMTLVIGLSFAEVISLLPIVGGISRFIGLTHNRTVSFIFLIIGWLSYVVYLPLEAQSAIQYLSFWFTDLVVVGGDGSATLSYLGLFCSFLIIISLTWFNTFFLSNVARVNALVSIWKILVPIGIAWLLIILFGNLDNMHIANINREFSFEKVLLAITSSGLAFAFTGFQNGLVLANSANNPSKAIPYSLFAPIIVGLILYASLSFIFIACLGDQKLVFGHAAAPLLALVALFGIHSIIAVLFVDAVIAPLGTANVYTAATSRILYGLAKDFFPDSWLDKLNKFFSPSNCLWFNAAIGALFLLPFPTWQQLVDFLSSIVVFSYLSGPISLMVLRKEFPTLKRPFKLSCYKLIGYTGFACCSLLIYWSNMNNLIYLMILIIAIIASYNVVIERRTRYLMESFKRSFFVLEYLLGIFLVKYLHHSDLILFPIDNLAVIILSLISCKRFIINRVDGGEIQSNLTRFSSENLASASYFVQFFKKN